MNTISRTAFLRETLAEGSQISEGEESITLTFDSFQQVAEFLVYAGQNSANNENSTSTSNREFYWDDATALAESASIDIAPGIYAVTFNGWRLT